MTLLISTCLILVLVTIYLFLDSLEDFKIKLKGPRDHTYNALVRSFAIFSMILLGYSSYITRELMGHWLLLLFGISMFLLFFGWFIFDLFYALHARVARPLVYLGSGDIDEFFKNEYGVRAPRIMLRVKLIGGTIALGFMIYTIILYQGNL